MPAPQVSVVIRCCNEEEHIGRLLSGILEQSVSDVDIVVVDSGSTDATLAIASRYPVTVRHIGRHEFTFGRSLNIGCAAARGDYIVIASAHVYPVYRDWLAKMLAPFSDPDIGLVYGQQRGDQRTKYSERQIFEKLYPDGAARRTGGLFCNNANAAIRRTLWQSQPYDESLTGLEDLAWAKAIAQLGHGVCYQGEGSVVHVHDERWRQICNRYRREAIALQSIVPDERFGMLDFLRCLVGNVWSDLRHAHREACLRAVWSEVLSFRLMQFWGTYSGYRTGEQLSDSLKQTFYYPKGWSHAPDLHPADQRAGLRIPYASLVDEDET